MLVPALTRSHTRWMIRKRIAFHAAQVDCQDLVSDLWIACPGWRLRMACACWPSRRKGFPRGGGDANEPARPERDRVSTHTYVRGEGFERLRNGSPVRRPHDRQSSVRYV